MEPACPPGDRRRARPVMIDFPRSSCRPVILQPSSCHGREAGTSCDVIRRQIRSSTAISSGPCLDRKRICSHFGGRAPSGIPFGKGRLHHVRLAYASTYRKANRRFRRENERSPAGKVAPPRNSRTWQTTRRGRARWVIHRTGCRGEAFERERHTSRGVEGFTKGHGWHLRGHARDRGRKIRETRGRNQLPAPRRRAPARAGIRRRPRHQPRAFHCGSARRAFPALRRTKPDRRRGTAMDEGLRRTVRSFGREPPCPGCDRGGVREALP